MKQIKHCNTETLSRAAHKLAKPVPQKQTLPRCPAAGPASSSPVPQRESVINPTHLLHTTTLYSVEKLSCSMVLRPISLPSNHNLTSYRCALPGAGCWGSPSHRIQHQTPRRNSHKLPARKPEVTTTTQQNSFQNRNSWNSRRKKKLNTVKIWFFPP